jgi:hypothetical protein
MVHHTRNTAAKQWDETRVLALAGVAKVFSTFFKSLVQLRDFAKVWAFLMEYIQDGIGQEAEEVSRAAVLALQDVFRAPTVAEIAAVAAAAANASASASASASAGGVDGGSGNGSVVHVLPPSSWSFDPGMAQQLWSAAWTVWLSAAKSTLSRKTPTPSMHYLNDMIESFPLAHRHLAGFFSEGDAMQMLVAGDVTVFLPFLALLLSHLRFRCVRDLNGYQTRAATRLLASDVYCLLVSSTCTPPL